MFQYLQIQKIRVISVALINIEVYFMPLKQYFWEMNGLDLHKPDLL